MDAVQEDQQTSRPAIVTPPPEAGFSVSWQMRDREGNPVTLTMRGAMAADWGDVLRARAKLLQAVSATGWGSMAGIPLATTTPANGNGGTASAPTTPPATPAQDGELYVDVSRIVVRPEPGDKVTLEFYADGHKYADAKAQKWTPPRAAALLVAFAGSVDVTRAVDVAARARVFYTLGKEYTTQSGEVRRYKDIARVEPLGS